MEQARREGVRAWRRSAVLAGALAFAWAEGAAAVPHHATFVDQSVLSVMEQGKLYRVRVRFKNTGTNSWSESQAFRLGSQNPQDNLTWGLNRVYLPPGTTVAPNQAFEFVFDVRAPAAAGTYNQRWRMVRDGVEWFGDFTPNVAVRVNASLGWKGTYLSRMCRVPSLGNLADRAAAPGFSYLDLADRLAQAGCRLFNWGGSGWDDATPGKAFAADDPYWDKAESFINRTKAGRPEARFIYTLAEVMHPSKVAVQEGLGPWKNIAPLQCLRDSPSLSRYMFRWFRKANDENVCTPPGVPVQPGGCRCSSDPTCPPNHYCPVVTEDPNHANHIPDVRQPATKAWWETLASHACDNGFQDINFSLAYRSASLDWPSYTNVQMVMSQVRSVACGADTRFGVEDLRRRPASGPLPSIGETFSKHVDGQRVLSTCGGTYSACGCFQFEDPGQSDDICIPKEKFESLGFPANYASPFVELDGDNKLRFLAASYEVRRRFLLHSLRSARATHASAVPGFFEVPMILSPGPDTAKHDVLGPDGQLMGWRMTWDDPEDQAGSLPLCVTPAFPQGAPSPIFGVMDLVSCGHGDLFPAAW